NGAVGVSGGSPAPQALSNRAPRIITVCRLIINRNLSIHTPFNKRRYFTWILIFVHSNRINILQFPFHWHAIMPAMVYLDYSATTPVDTRVVDGMTPYFSVSYGNPSSVHRYGQVAEAAIDSARETIAATLN